MPDISHDTPDVNVGPGGPPVDNPEVHHEYSDINVRAIFLFLVGLVLTAVFVTGAMWLLFDHFNAREVRAEPPRAPLSMPAGRQPPEPRLQTTPRLDMRMFRQAEDQALGSYAWVDEKTGTVRIPIDRAMQLVVERGLPVSPQPVAERLAPSSLGPSSGRPGGSARASVPAQPPPVKPEPAKPPPPHKH